MILLKSPREIEKMRSASGIVAEILAVLRESVRPGVTTFELDEIAEREAARRKARPAFKGYSGYPYSLCCSPNSQVVHGMPTRKELVEGDIVSLDFGVVYHGFYGDAAITVPVGTVSEQARRLIRVTEESLDLAIAAAVPGGRLSDISHAVQKHVEANGYSVVRDFVGHGIGKRLHESPQVPNFGEPGCGVRLRPGLVLAIEPMINEKGCQVKVLDDGWTAVTCDGGLSAHCEHTVAITDNGPDILSRL
ncbi:type I methionyl aminopeptidase [Geobacter pickeringii]|uniref:type I methionyl aminopeptidase n=1 Tax=Geobacter pickeringii TaxID=345632 RepID=UPI0009FFBA55|nr:type I methionyl aminopeptidase [Geobacter pickeringii]